MLLLLIDVLSVWTHYPAVLRSPIGLQWLFHNGESTVRSPALGRRRRHLQAPLLSACGMGAAARRRYMEEEEERARNSKNPGLPGLPGWPGLARPGFFAGPVDPAGAPPDRLSSQPNGRGGETQSCCLAQMDVGAAHTLVTRLVPNHHAYLV